MTDTSGIDAYLSGLAPEVRPIAVALRLRIEALGPNLSPGFAWGFPSWKGLERLFSILGHSHHVNLQMWNGARLAEQFPKRIEGTGKALRHVKLRAMSDLDNDLDKIIKAAIALDLSDPQKVR